jgi:hypothetical protein
MPAVTIRLLAAALVAAIAVSSAGAVGLGPLRLEGVTRTDRKGFYLTLINPYRVQERFRVYSIETDSENAVPRVRIPISTLLLGGQAQRRILVVDSDLGVGKYTNSEFARSGFNRLERIWSMPVFVRRLLLVVSLELLLSSAALAQQGMSLPPAPQGPVVRTRSSQLLVPMPSKHQLE